MTSDHTPGTPTPRRRMAGYKPLDTPPSAPASDTAPALVPHKTEPAHRSSSASTAAGAAEPLSQRSLTTSAPSPALATTRVTVDSSATAENQATADAPTHMTTATEPTARKRRLGG